MTAKQYIVQCCCAKECKSKGCTYKAGTTVDADIWDGGWRKKNMGCRRSRHPLRRMQAMIDIVSVIDALPA